MIVSMKKRFDRMFKNARLLAVFAFAITALFLLPAVSFASPRTTSTASSTTTVSLAFTGAVPGTDTALTGGLTIGIRDTGYFNGNFHEPDGTQISVSGKLKSNGDFNITFYTAKGVPFILGVGKPNSAGEFVGTFQIVNGPSGIWSALPVSNPYGVLALAFTGKVGATFLSGAIVLNDKTLVGTFNLANGAVLPVSATLLKDDKYAIRVNFGNGAIIGYGKSVDNPANPVDKGFAGPFTVTASGAVGTWAAYFFSF